MGRAPLISSFVLFLALIASLSFWAMQLLAPPPRMVAAAPQSSSRPAPPIAAAANVFGGRGSGKTMMNVQLRGVVLAGRAKESVAILAAEGGAPRPLRLEGEVLPGVKVQEIHPRYVVLSDHGVLREVSLPEFAAAGAVESGAVANAAPVNNARVPTQQASEVSSGASTGAVTGNTSPGAVVQQAQPQPQQPQSPSQSSSQLQAQPPGQSGNAQLPGSRQRQEFPQPVTPVR
jgi:general secretion pathway protein C